MYKSINNYLSNYRGNILIYKILFALSICYFFSFSFFGLDFTDTFFHLNNAKDSNFSDINFLTILSTLIIKFILQFITQDILTLRIINGVIKISPLFIYLFYFRISKASFLVWTFIILILVTPNNSFILGYDSLSIFMLTLILLILIKGEINLSYRILVLLSMLSSCAILMRLPNVLVIGIVFLSVFFGNLNRNVFSIENFRKACFYLVLSLLFIVSFYFLVYGNINSLIASNNVIVNNYGHHGVYNLLHYYFRDFRKIVFFSIEIILFIWLFFKINNSEKYKNWFISILIVMHLMFFFKNILISAYSYSFSLYVTSVMIVFLIHNIFYNIRTEFKTKGFFIFYLFFLFIEPFGSNTGLLKSAPLLIIFPFAYDYSKLNFKKVYLVLFVSILPFAIIEKANSIYEDSSLNKLRYTTEINTINNINTSKERVLFINAIDKEYKNLTKKNYTVFFYGNKSQIFKYLYPTFDLKIKDFHQPIDDPLFFDQILMEINRHKKVAFFIINDYPSLNYVWCESKLEKELVKNNFTPVFKNNFTYYRK